jgi:hypothetical protein
MRGTADVAVAVIPALLGALGLMPDAAAPWLPPFTRTLPLLHTAASAFNPIAPDSPPPRG